MFQISNITFQLSWWQQPWRVKSGMLHYQQYRCSHSLLPRMLALGINGHAWHAWQAIQGKGKEGKKGEWSMIQNGFSFPPLPLSSLRLHSSVLINRLFTVVYFSVRSSRSRALRYGLPILHECQNYLGGDFSRPSPPPPSAPSHNPQRPPPRYILKSR